MEKVSHEDTKTRGFRMECRVERQRLDVAANPVGRLKPSEARVAFIKCQIRNPFKISLARV